MSRYINRRTLLAVALLLALATFLPPLVNVSRFAPSFAGDLSRALGRPVTIGEVRLRLFPVPGLDLKRVVVQDDPAFSAEPLLRAGEVKASLRLASLWRGRLEIASLSLSYPSLNLVRAPNGHWNLESLLERARQTPTAPTSKLRPESRSRFPYIEANGGRINLKLGQEKTVYALSETDFALSLPSENAWQLRLSARPMRTDANLSDTGSVKISGTVQRGSTLADTPLDLRVVLDRAQLGQLTTLIYGRDRGWRGTVNVAAVLRGTPGNLKITSDSSVDDFRRYDIGTRGSLRLAARCSAAFSTATQQLTDLACRAPVGSGLIEFRGSVRGVLPMRGYAITVNVKDLPTASLMALGQRMKKDLPEDLQAGGAVSAEFDLHKSNGTVSWTGSGTTSALRLNSKLMNAPLDLGNLRFVLGIPVAPPLSRPVLARQGGGFPNTTGKSSASAPSTTALRISPFALDLGATAPAKVQAWFAHHDYQIDVQGDARANRLLELANAFGIHAPQSKITGLATADLHVAGSWSGFAAPAVTGNALLRSSTATIPGIAAPLQVASAAIHLSPDAAAIYNLVGSFTGTHLSFTGSLQVPRVCPNSPCPIAFQLRADQLSSDELNLLLNPRAQKRRWFNLIGAGSSQPALLAKVTAVGKLSAARVEVKTLAARRVSGDLRLEAGVLTVRNLRAEVLGGTTTAEFRADFTGIAPAYSLHGTLQQASVTAIAALTRDAWGTGRANATYRMMASGWDAGQLRSNAMGSVAFDWNDGSLANIALTGAPAPLKLRHFQGELTLADGQFTFGPSKMETPGGIYVVSGTASLDRELGLRLRRGKTEAYDVTGTVEKPRVTSTVLPTTQAAAIKP
jgi:hypothetical protein